MLSASLILKRALTAIGAVASLLPALSGTAGPEALVGLIYGVPMSVSPAFGNHTELYAAMDPAGETVLAWVYNTGEGHRLQLTTLAPGAAEAQPTMTVASSGHTLGLSKPAMADNGRTAVAWVAERESEQVWSREALGVSVRDRLPNGTWAATRSLWRAAPHSRWGIQSLGIATDQAGDEAVVWLMRRELRSSSNAFSVMVATRSAGGTFTRPTAIASETYDAAPAVAINEAGEVTLLWCATTQIRTATWMAGSSPPPESTILDQTSSAEEQLNIGGFSALAIEVGGKDAELATWLKGTSERTRPEPVALRAAWREPSAEFTPAYTVTAPGVDVREATVAFPVGGTALIAWSQVNADGSGPDLDYASGEAGTTPTAANVGPVPAKHLQLKASWLEDGSAMLLWRNGAHVMADRLVAGGALGTPTAIGRLSEEFGEPTEELQLAAGGASSPVFAWIGRSPADSATQAVRYLPAYQLGNNPQPPSADATVVGNQLAHTRSFTISAECPEACKLTARGELFGLREENEEEAAASFYRPLGSLHTASATLAAGERKPLTLHASQDTLSALCRSTRAGDSDAVELQVSVRMTSGVERQLVLGDRPVGPACP